MVAKVETSPIVMPTTTTTEGSKQDEDAIKNAVREAALKTQERMAAYQKKQAEVKVKQLENTKPKAISADADSTVSKLQALVDESRRLTVKSKELNNPNGNKRKDDAAIPPPLPGLTRSKTVSDVKNLTASTNSRKGKNLSELFQSLNSSASSLGHHRPELHRSATFDCDGSVTSIGSARGKKLGELFQSLNGSNANLSVGTMSKKQDSVRDLLESTISPELLQQMQDKHRRSSKGELPPDEKDNDSTGSSSGEGSSPEVDIDEDDDFVDEGETKKSAGAPSFFKNNNNSTAPATEEYSIFNLVAKKDATAAAGIKLRADEAQDLMEDFYSDRSNRSHSEMPPLDDILETPKPEKVKPKLGGSARKKKKGKSDDDLENSMPLSALEDDMDASMPCLAPFETPVISKPKLGQATIVDDNSHRQAIPEESLNLSQVMRQPDSRSSPNDNSARSMRRASMDGSKRGQRSLRRIAEDNASTKSLRSSRKGRSKENEDDNNNNNNKSAARITPKGARARKSIKRADDIGNRAINKYHRKGDGSSTMEGIQVCEKTGEVITGGESIDVSGISEESPDLQDDSLGTDSSHSTQSASSAMSRSKRRGRTLVDNSTRARGASRSVSSRRSTRSVSRSANNRNRRRAEDDNSTRSLSKVTRRHTVGDDSNSSLGKMKDASMRRSSRMANNGRGASVTPTGRRRRSISTRRGAGRRSHRRGGSGDEDESEASTADEILGALDLSDIHIVGDNDEKGTASALDLGGKLSKLESIETKGKETEGEGSVNGSIVSKKSKVGKFARKVGRTLIMKKKKKSATGAEEDVDDEDDTEVEDVDLAQLAADFDEEEKEILEESGLLNDGVVAKGDISLLQGLDDLADDPENTKKKGRKSVFGKIKKIGMIGKKKKDKKKDKKGKGSELLASDSESDDDEDTGMIRSGSGYSEGTPDNKSDVSDYEYEEPDEFVQLKIDDSGSEVVNGSEHGDDPMIITPTKSRQRRSSVVNTRRQRASQQRNQSLVAALDCGDKAMSASMRHQRRARSMRGKSVRRGEMDDETETRRAKSVRGRIEGEVVSMSKSMKNRSVRRCKTFEEGGEKEEEPAFDWSAYSAKKESAAAKETAKEAAKKGKGRKDRKSMVDGSQKEKRMMGGLSKIIYAAQEVQS